MERIARIPRLQSDLWETNAGYKITLPIQIGKLMVAFVDSLFGPRDNGGLLNYYPEIYSTKFRECRFSQIFTRFDRQFSKRAQIFPFPDIRYRNSIFRSKICELIELMLYFRSLGSGKAKIDQLLPRLRNYYLVLILKSARKVTPREL